MVKKLNHKDSKVATSRILPSGEWSDVVCHWLGAEESRLDELRVTFKIDALRWLLLVENSYILTPGDVNGGKESESEYLVVVGHA